MIGSSPDVIMTNKEWHVGVFGDKKILRKGALFAFRSLGIRSFQSLRRYAFKKTLETLSPDDLAEKPDAQSCVIKLMDYHIIFSEMIRQSFDRATFITLTRHPYGQCESLMRSGLSLDSACRWYREVARMMADRSASGTVVRFEEVVARPMDACDELYESLGVRWSEDGKFNFKIKAYGARRTADVDVRHGEVIRVGADDVGRHIDASVLRGERERLSDAQRKAIWSLTGEVAAHFGYTEVGSC
jgi:hypothetical protein